VDSTNKAKQYIGELKKTLDGLDTKAVGKLADLLVGACEDGRQVFIFGNGGSAATASHLACDLNKGCSYGLEKRFKVICLNDNVPVLMAYANDVGYDAVFAEQLKNFVKKGDVVIGISGSGNSKNVLAAIEVARGAGAVTVGMCGFEGGKLKGLVDLPVHAAVNDMQKAEDVHLIVAHIVMQAACDRLGLKYH
jgi:D-sedoheptulose 7-phosphate isomerase